MNDQLEFKVNACNISWFNAIGENIIVHTQWVIRSQMILSWNIYSKSETCSNRCPHPVDHKYSGWIVSNLVVPNLMAYYWTPTKLNGSRNWMAHQIEWLTKMTGSPNWIAHQSEWLTKLNGSLSNWMTHHWKARKTKWVTIEWLTELNGSLSNEKLGRTRGAWCILGASLPHQPQSQVLELTLDDTEIFWRLQAFFFLDKSIPCFHFLEWNAP